MKEEQYDYLLRESQNKGKSIAQIIREIIDKSLSSKKSEAGEITFWNIGEDRFTTGIKDGSASHDNIIYRSKNQDNAE